MDLPPDIRNIIYSVALVVSEPIIMSLDYRRPRYESIDTSLLRTCRQINQEAIPILYGENTFEACYGGPIRAFVHQIGNSATMLRNVELNWFDTKPTTTSICRAVEKMTGVQVLTIGYRTRKRGSKPEKMAKLLTPMMKALQRSREGTDRK